MVVLGNHGELSSSEISHVLGIPLGTVKARMRLALERLHDDLNAQNDPRARHKDALDTDETWPAVSTDPLLAGVQS